MSRPWWRDERPSTAWTQSDYGSPACDGFPSRNGQSRAGSARAQVAQPQAGVRNTVRESQSLSAASPRSVVSPQQSPARILQTPSTSVSISPSHSRTGLPTFAQKRPAPIAVSPGSDHCANSCARGFPTSSAQVGYSSTGNSPLRKTNGSASPITRCQRSHSAACRPATARADNRPATARAKSDNALVTSPPTSPSAKCTSVYRLMLGAGSARPGVGHAPWEINPKLLSPLLGHRLFEDEESKCSPG